MLVTVFLSQLSDSLKDLECALINSTLGICLKDRKFEQKYIASRTVVFPALLCPYKIEIFFSNLIFKSDIDLKSWIERDDIRTTTRA